MTAYTPARETSTSRPKERCGEIIDIDEIRPGVPCEGNDLAANDPSHQRQERLPAIPGADDARRTENGDGNAAVSRRCRQDLFRFGLPAGVAAPSKLGVTVRLQSRRAQYDEAGVVAAGKLRRDAPGQSDNGLPERFLFAGVPRLTRRPCQVEQNPLRPLFVAARLERLSGTEDSERVRGTIAPLSAAISWKRFPMKPVSPVTAKSAVLLSRRQFMSGRTYLPPADVSISVPGEDGDASVAASTALPKARCWRTSSMESCLASGLLSSRSPQRRSCFTASAPSVSESGFCSPPSPAT